MTSENHTAQTRFIRKDEVKRRAGFRSDSGLYDAVARGDFPRPVKIGTRASAWVEAEIDAWIDRKIAASRGELRVA